MREGTTLRVMAADRLYGEFYDFYSISPEYFGYTLILALWTTKPIHWHCCCFLRGKGSQEARLQLPSITCRGEELYFLSCYSWLNPESVGWMGPSQCRVKVNANGLMFVLCVIRCSRNNRHNAQICDQPLGLMVSVSDC
jgi:hypothetical protein